MGFRLSKSHPTFPVNLRNGNVTVEVPLLGTVRITLKGKFPDTGTDTTPVTANSQLVTLCSGTTGLVLFKNSACLVYNTLTSEILDTFPAEVPKQLLTHDVIVVGHALGKSGEKRLVALDRDWPGIALLLKPYSFEFVQILKIAKPLPDALYFSGLYCEPEGEVKGVLICKEIPDVDWREYLAPL